MERPGSGHDPTADGPAHGLDEHQGEPVPRAAPVCSLYRALLGEAGENEPACCPPGRCQIRLRAIRMGLKPL